MRSAGGRLIAVGALHSRQPSERRAASAALLGRRCRASAADLTSELRGRLAERCAAAGMRLVTMAHDEILLDVAADAAAAAASETRAAAAAVVEEIASARGGGAARRRGTRDDAALGRPGGRDGRRRCASAARRARARRLDDFSSD